VTVAGSAVVSILARMTPTSAQWKSAAIACWTADPCAANTVGGEPGTREYFEQLLDARRRYAPWMAEVLDFRGSGGFDVLDVGCGQGIDLANNALAGARVTGIDLTARHVELARSHLTALGLTGIVVEGDAEDLPFANESFDRVTSNGVLHHTPDIGRALREIHRVLRRGGETRIIVYNRNSFHYWLAQVAWLGIVRGQLWHERSMGGVLARGVEHSTIGARPLVHVYSAAGLRRLLIDAGFGSVATTVRHFAAGDTPITSVLEPHVALLRRRDVLDRIGRVGGWYVVGRGIRR
jgi:SAM-dependent methyltransferase